MQNFHENLLQSSVYVVLLFYIIFDIFMVMNFGNEIKISSNRLSYCLFESNWIDQSNENKKRVIILTEILKQPYQLIVCKVYPLDLKSFSAVSFFRKKKYFNFISKNVLTGITSGLQHVQYFTEFSLKLNHFFQ